MQTPGNAFVGIKGNIVLYRGELEARLVVPVPVFFKPAAVIAVNRELKNQQPSDRGFGDR